MQLAYPVISVQTRKAAIRRRPAGSAPIPRCLCRAAPTTSPSAGAHVPAISAPGGPAPLPAGPACVRVRLCARVGRSPAAAASASRGEGAGGRKPPARRACKTAAPAASTPRRCAAPPGSSARIAASAAAAVAAASAAAEGTVRRMGCRRYGLPEPDRRPERRTGGPAVTPRRVSARRGAARPAILVALGAGPPGYTEGGASRSSLRSRRLRRTNGLQRYGPDPSRLRAAPDRPLPSAPRAPFLATRASRPASRPAAAHLRHRVVVQVRERPVPDPRRPEAVHAHHRPGPCPGQTPSQPAARQPPAAAAPPIHPIPRRAAPPRHRGAEARAAAPSRRWASRASSCASAPPRLCPARPQAPAPDRTVR